MKGPTLHYTLSGFSHDMGYRVFSFQMTTDAHVHRLYRVRADLALARKYGIPVQELPLLCRTFLEHRQEGESRLAYTYGEEEMRDYSERCAARIAELQKRKAVRRPPSQNTGRDFNNRL